MRPSDAHRPTAPSGIGLFKLRLQSAVLRDQAHRAMPDQEQYRADREAMSRLLDDLDDAWFGERHRVTRRPST
jgi:hypothetical protein